MNMYALIILAMLKMISGFSTTSFPRIFAQGDVFKYNSNFKKIDSIYDIVSQKENYCFISTLSKDIQIQNYPFGSVMGYALCEEGLPIIAIPNSSRHAENILFNNSVSIAILDKYTNDIFKKRIILTGNIRKIENDIEDGFVIPSEETLKLKKQYSDFHPTSLWVEYPDVDMYVFDVIKDVYFISGFKKAEKINIYDYLNHANNYFQ